MSDTPKPLKLLALEPEDLAIVSAALQDAVFRVGDLAFIKNERRFAAVLNRFAWETGAKERRRAGLDFSCVLNVRTFNLDLGKPDRVLNLLAISFDETEKPSGQIEMIFSGDISILLDVECIEARLSDLGGAWASAHRPRHPV